MEGLSLAGNIQGNPVDALVAILQHHSIPNVLKWVDNFCIFCSPSHSSYDSNGTLIYHYPFKLQSVHDITGPLGVPWHLIEIKGQDFGSTVPYIGFV